MNALANWIRRLLSGDSMDPAPSPPRPTRRRCGNCKHWDLSDRGGGKCAMINNVGSIHAEVINRCDPQEVGELFTSRDFGCVLWESREAIDGVTPVTGERIDLAVDNSGGPHGVYEASVGEWEDER